jgi:hypothetical protein
VDHKIIGILLLVFGIVLIGFATFNIYQVFTGQAQSINLFSSNGISLDLKQLVPSGDSIANSRLELLSADSLNKTFNLSFHLLLMGFVSSAGFKLASLGNQLLRPIEVHLKTIEKPTPVLQS